MEKNTIDFNKNIDFNLRNNQDQENMYEKFIKNLNDLDFNPLNFNQFYSHRFFELIRYNKAEDYQRITLNKQDKNQNYTRKKFRNRGSNIKNNQLILNQQYEMNEYLKLDKQLIEEKLNYFSRYQKEELSKDQFDKYQKSRITKNKNQYLEKEREYFVSDNLKEQFHNLFNYLDDLNFESTQFKNIKQDSFKKNQILTYKNYNIRDKDYEKNLRSFKYQGTIQDTNYFILNQIQREFFELLEINLEQLNNCISKFDSNYLEKFFQSKESSQQLNQYQNEFKNTFEETKAIDQQNSIDDQKFLKNFRNEFNSILDELTELKIKPLIESKNLSNKKKQLTLKKHKTKIIKNTKLSKLKKKYFEQINHEESTSAYSSYQIQQLQNKNSQTQNNQPAVKEEECINHKNKPISFYKQLKSDPGKYLKSVENKFMKSMTKKNKITIKPNDQTFNNQIRSMTTLDFEPTDNLKIVQGKNGQTQFQYKSRVRHVKFFLTNIESNQFILDSIQRSFSKQLNIDTELIDQTLERYKFEMEVVNENMFRKNAINIINKDDSEVIDILDERIDTKKKKLKIIKNQNRKYWTQLSNLGLRNNQSQISKTPMLVPKSKKVDDVNSEQKKQLTEKSKEQWGKIREKQQKTNKIRMRDWVKHFYESDGSKMKMIEKRNEQRKKSKIQLHTALKQAKNARKQNNINKNLEKLNGLNE